MTWGKTFARRLAHPLRTFRNARYLAGQRVMRPVIERRGRSIDRVLEAWIEKDDFPLPSIVMFETISQCNGTCAFCPANRLVDKRGRNFMPWEIIDKAFTELGRLHYSGWFSFHINNEPLLDDRLPEIFRHAQATVPDAFIQCWTNGTLIDWEKHRVLFDAGLNYMRINNYSAQGRWHRNVRDFMDRFAASEYATRARIEFAATIRDPNAILTNKGGLAPNKLAGPDFVQSMEKCHLPIWQLPINYKGEVFLCCHDNFYSEPMGSLHTSTITEIWNSVRYRDFRRALLAGDRSVAPVCSRCDVVTTSGILQIRERDGAPRVWVAPGLVSKPSLRAAYGQGAVPVR